MYFVFNLRIIFTVFLSATILLVAPNIANAEEKQIQGPFDFQFGAEIEFDKICKGSTKEKLWTALGLWQFQYTDFFNSKNRRSESDVVIFGLSYPEIKKLVESNSAKWKKLPKSFKKIIKENPSNDYVKDFWIYQSGMFLSNKIIEAEYERPLEEPYLLVASNFKNLEYRVISISNYTIHCGREPSEYRLVTEVLGEKLNNFIKPFTNAEVRMGVVFNKETDQYRLVSLRIKVREEEDRELFKAKIRPALAEKYGRPKARGDTWHRWLTKDGLLVVFDEECTVNNLTYYTCIQYESLGHQLLGFQEDLLADAKVIDFLLEKAEGRKKTIATDDL